MNKVHSIIAAITPTRKNARRYVIGVRKEAGGVRFCFGDTEKDVSYYCAQVDDENSAIDTDINTYCWLTAPAAKKLIEMIQSVL